MKHDFVEETLKNAKSKSFFDEAKSPHGLNRQTFVTFSVGLPSTLAVRFLDHLIFQEIINI